MSKGPFLVVLLVSTVIASAQQPFAQPPKGSDQTQLSSDRLSNAQNPIPLVVKFTGSLRGIQGQSSPALIGVTFALYKEEAGGAPLWTETQNVAVDAQGRFSVLLGAASREGLPPDVFASGDARWLGITPDDGVERARVMLASVPYAFKAADAQTIGGRAPDEFVTQEQLHPDLRRPVGDPPPVWRRLPSDTSKADIFEALASSGPSFISDATTGPPFEIRSSTLVPNLNVDLLHGFTDSAFAKLTSNNEFIVNQQFKGGVSFPPIPGDGGAAESSGPQDFEANGLSAPGAGLTSQTFRWQANGFNQNLPQSQLSLSFGSGGQTPQPTGFTFNSDGTINFAPAQTFPGNAIYTAVAPFLGSGGESGGGSGDGTVSETPTGTQTITQPPGTTLNVNNLNNTRTVQASDNWIVGNIATPLTAGVQATLTLTPCPVGVDTSGSLALGGPKGGYPIYIVDGALPNTNSESVYVTGGTCTSAATSGTIIFTPYFSHAMSTYTIGSASGGIQEAINDACGTNTTTWWNRGCHVVIPPAGPQAHSGSYFGYDVYDTIYFHANDSMLSGYGAILNCHERGPCLQVGDLSNSNDYTSNTIEGISFRSMDNRRSDPAFNGSLIQATERIGGTITIQTATPHNLRTGDRVTQMLTDTSNYWGDVPSITVTDATHYTYTRANTADIPFQATPGIVALSYEAVLDNGSSTSLVDLQYDNTYEYGAFNHFFDFWDDENAQIEKFTNNAIPLNANANWTGSFVWSGGASTLPNKSQQLAPVITVKNSSFTANGSNCATVYNSNGFYVQDSVCQAQGPWEFLVSTISGNYQGADFQNIYSESGYNPASPAKSPWPGLGVAGFIGGPTSGAGGYSLKGQGGFGGGLPVVGGGGSTTYVYYVVARDVTAGTQTSPLPFMYDQNPPGQVIVQWPRLAAGTETIVYDLLRNVAPAGTIWAAGGSYVAPYAGGCNGGSASACGSVAVGLAQCSGFVCSFTDDTANATSAYSIKGGNFVPNPTFWPGSAVLSSTALISDRELQVTGIAFNWNPTLYAAYCSANGANVSGGYTVCTGSTNAVADQPATILTVGTSAGGGGVAGAKGRLIFESDGPAPHQIITIYDSNPQKTQATTGHRPVGDPGDMYLGIDSNGYLMVGGGAKGIAHYVNNIGDGTNYGELLTSALKTFNVPVQFNQYAQFDQGVLATAGCVGCSPFSPAGTQVADNFSYAGSLNSNWTVGEGAWAVSNGWSTSTALGNDSLGFAIYSGATFANDQTVQAAYNGSGYSGICVRTANTASLTGYCLGGGSGDTDVAYLMRRSSGSGHVLCTLNYSGMGQGTTLLLSAIGTTITAKFINNGVLTNMCSVTDSNITSGYPAIFVGGTGGALSKFIAGDAAASTSQNISFNGPVSVNGAVGFSGMKTAGSCIFTIVSGLITNITGC